MGDTETAEFLKRAVRVALALLLVFAGVVLGATAKDLWHGAATLVLPLTVLVVIVLLRVGRAVMSSPGMWDALSSKLDRWSAALDVSEAIETVEDILEDLDELADQGFVRDGAGFQVEHARDAVDTLREALLALRP